MSRSSRHFVLLSSLFLLIALFQNQTVLQPGHEVVYNAANAVRLSSLVASASLDPVTRHSTVLIGKNQVAYIDQSIDFNGTIHIRGGQLHCDPTNTPAGVELKVGRIYIDGISETINGSTQITPGIFQCGTAAQRWSKKLYISLKHSEIPTDSAGNYITVAHRAIIVNPYGRLVLTGGPRNNKWVRLNRTAEIGSTSITVDSTVRGSGTNWQVGDEIVIGPTSYDHTQAEKFRITSFSADGLTIYLDGALQHRHWGETENFTTPSNEILRLDQRAEVANLTRNIVIRPDESTAAISELDDRLGQVSGHVMIHANGFAAVNAVEFYKMGQAGYMGRYPFHWHLVGDGSNQFVINSSIHRSFQRCITIHGTNKVRLENNVCYDFKGHGFFLEDGDEVDNEIRGNLGILSKYPTSQKFLLASDNPENGSQIRRFHAVSTFWISNPQNIVVGNVASGSVGTGFWMSFTGPVQRFNTSLGRYDGPILARPREANTTQFSDNIAHSSLVGINWDGAAILPADDMYPQANTNRYSTNNPNNPADRMIDSSPYQPEIVPVFSRLSSFKNRYTGIYFRGNTAIFDRVVLSDNGWSIFAAYNQIFRNSVIINQSNNSGPFDRSFLERNFVENRVGIVLYDGPFELKNVGFHKFSESAEYGVDKRGRTIEITSTPFMAVGGAGKFTNITSQLKFTPEPYYRVLMEPTDGGGWLDKELTNRLKDLDGSLTGRQGGGILLPEKKIAHPSAGCESPGPRIKGFMLCPLSASNLDVTFRFSSSSGKNKIPHLVLRSDGETSFPMEQWDMIGISHLGNLEHNSMLTKFTHIANSNFSYTYMFNNRFSDGSSLTNLRFRSYSTQLNQVSPPIKMVGLGSNCSLQGATRAASLAQLSSLAAPAYFSDGNDLHVKVQTTNRVQQIHRDFVGDGREYLSTENSIVCSEPILPRVVGISSTTKVSSQNFRVSGWVCEQGSSAAKLVKVYVGGRPEESASTLVSSVPADLTPSAGVSFACIDSSGAPHRFNLNLDFSSEPKHYGKKVYFYTESSSGNIPLPGAAVETIGVPASSGPLGVIAGTIGAPVNGGPIRGWACEKKYNGPIKVQIYAGDPAAGGVLIREVYADMSSETAVSTACETTGIPHRFSLDLTNQERTTHQGKRIFVRGISSQNNSSLNKNLTRSGEYTIPGS